MGFSNLLMNTTRGIFAEYMVARLLHLDDKPRNPWSEADIVTRNGIKIEVKASSYIQAWKQKAPSKIIFSGLKSYKYSDELGWKRISNEKEYHADIYIFCVFTAKKKDIDILDLNHWDFYVLSREELRKISGDSSSISLSKIQKHGIHPIKATELRRKIEEIEKML